MSTAGVAHARALRRTRQSTQARLIITTVATARAVAGQLSSWVQQAASEFALRHPRGGSNTGRPIKLVLYHKSAGSSRSHRPPTPARVRQMILRLALPPGLVHGADARLTHLELIYYGVRCSGHWHTDPPRDGDEVAVLTLRGRALFRLRDGNFDIVDAVRTQPGTLVLMRGPARQKPCMHHAGKAENGDVRIALQLGFAAA